MRPAQRFKKWLEQHILAEHNGTRLPTYAAMAAQWNISQSTVRSVLNSFRATDKVYSIPGRGTFIGLPEQHAEKDTDDLRPLSSRDSIVEAFLRAIQRGDFRRGHQLPPVKQVCFQFQVKPATVTRAYRALTRMGYTEQVGKRYWVGNMRSLTNIHAHKEVYFFCDNPDSFSELFDESSVWQNVFAEVDYELTECNVQLRLETKETLEEHVKTWIRSMRFPLGIIHANCAEPDADSIFRTMRRLIDKAGPDAPNIIATIKLGAKIPDRIPRFCTYIHHGNENTMVARSAAQFCRTENFHAVSYFCDNIMHCREALRFLVELHHADASEKLKIIVNLPDPVSTNDDLLNAMEQRLWTKEYLGGLMAKYGELQINDFLNRIWFVPDNKTVFRISLKRSLWLFMNAESASAAVQWCKAANRSLVTDISIIGFGNAATYLHYGISSCSVDRRVFGYRIAHAVMGSLPIEKTHKGFFRIAARLFERRTARMSRGYEAVC